MILGLLLACLYLLGSKANLWLANETVDDQSRLMISKVVNISRKWVVNKDSIKSESQSIQKRTASEPLNVIISKPNLREN